RAGAGDRYILADSAGPAIAAHGLRRDRGDDRVVGAGDQQGEAAIAAAPADALSHDAARIRLRRRKRAADHARGDVADAFDVDIAGRIAGPAIAAHASRGADAAILQGERAAEAAIAARTADRLRENAVRREARGRNVAGAADMGVARDVAGAAGAADRNADVGRFLGRRHGGRNREPAVAAAARDRFG